MTQLIDGARHLLIDFRTCETIRTATAAELAASILAAQHDGGAGVITVDGRLCYVDIDGARHLLIDYRTGETIRTATAAELAASISATQHDGGAGVITVDGRLCYVD